MQSSILKINRRSNNNLNSLTGWYLLCYNYLAFGFVYQTNTKKENDDEAQSLAF